MPHLQSENHETQVVHSLITNRCFFSKQRHILMQQVQHSNDSSQDVYNPAQTSLTPVNSAVQLATSQPQPDSDAALAAELSPWITCATMLAKVAASVAAQSCCQDLQYSINQGTQHSSISSQSSQQKALQDSQAKEALTKVGSQDAKRICSALQCYSLSLHMSGSITHLTAFLCVHQIKYNRDSICKLHCLAAVRTVHN